MRSKCSVRVWYGHNDFPFRVRRTAQSDSTVPIKIEDRHPPQSARHKTEQGCRFGRMCASLHPHTKAPSKKPKKDQTSKKATIGIARSRPKLGWVSQDVELPEPTVGITNKIRYILKKNSNTSPRALKYTATAESFIKNREHLGRSHGNPDAPTFENRDLNNTLEAEGGTRKAA